MTDGLTEAAKKEIQEAIRIIREDRFEKFVRSRTAPKPADPPADPPKPNDPPTPPAPKPNDPPADPPKPNDPPTDKEYSRYWGEIFN